MVTPLLAELRRLWPNSRIDLLTRSASAEILSTNPHVSSVIVDSLAHSQNRFSDYWKTYRAIRKAKYDACFLSILSLGFSYSSRMTLARIPRRVIHAYDFRPEDDHTLSCTHRVPFDQTRHDVESNLDLLRAVTDAEVDSPNLTLPVTEDMRLQARKTLEQSGWEHGKTVGICPGSGPTMLWKRWPLEKYAGFSKRLLADHQDVKILAFCGPDEEEDAEFLRINVEDERFLVVKGMPLESYPAAVELCNVVVSADSLPVHVCAALQKPIVALHGPTDPRRTGPWKCPAKVIAAKCDYAPFTSVPYLPDPAEFDPCMPLIPTEEVLAATEEFLHI